MEEAFDPFGIEDSEVCPESSFLTTTSTSSNNRSRNSISNKNILNNSHDSQHSINKSSSSSSMLNFQSQFDASFAMTPNGKYAATRKVTPSSATNKSINSSIDSDIYSQLFQIGGGEGGGIGGEDDKDLSMYGSVGNNDTSFDSEMSSSSTPKKNERIKTLLSFSPETSVKKTVDGPNPNPKSIIKESSKYSNSQPEPPVSPFVSPMSQSNTNIMTTNTHMKLPVYVNLHETMSCVYDDTKQLPHFDIDGEITLIPNKFIQGQSFYISLRDPSNHVGEVTTYFDCARELPLNCVGEDDPFVKIKQAQNCRVFKVDIPGSLMQLDMKPIRVMKFNGSDFLRPIPLLVHCKVRVGGTLCRVGVKVRSNPTNKKNIKNVAILMAVPPDVSGETMKMSLRGGVWDPMRRIIIWSAPSMKSGETVEFQLQFEYTAVNNLLPAFPVLVRCDADDQLSGVQIEVGGEKYYDANGDAYKQSGASPFKMNLSTSYRLFHRKT